MTDAAFTPSEFPETVKVSGPQEPGDPSNGGGRSSLASSEDLAKPAEADKAPAKPAARRAPAGE